MTSNIWMPSAFCLLLTYFHDFACYPTLEILESLVESRPGLDVTFSCRVGGRPAPVVYWVVQNREVVDAMNNPNSDQFFVYEGPVEGKSSSGENDRWSNLTLRRITDQNAGGYMCVASNEDGVSVANVSLHVLLVPMTDFRDYYSEISPGTIFLITAAIAVTLFVASIIMVRVLRRRRRKPRENGRGISNAEHC